MYTRTPEQRMQRRRELARVLGSGAYDVPYDSPALTYLPPRAPLIRSLAEGRPPKTKRTPLACLPLTEANLRQVLAEHPDVADAEIGRYFDRCESAVQRARKRWGIAPNGRAAGVEAGRHG